MLILKGKQEVFSSRKLNRKMDCPEKRSGGVLNKAGKGKQAGCPEEEEDIPLAVMLICCLTLG